MHIGKEPGRELIGPWTVRGQHNWSTLVGMGALMFLLDGFMFAVSL